MGTGYWLAVPCYHGEIWKTIGAFQLKKCIISDYFYQISLLLITTNHPNRQYLIFYNLSIKINCEKKYVPKNTHMTLSSAVAMSNSTEFILLVAHNSDSVCCPATAFFFFLTLVMMPHPLLIFSQSDTWSRLLIQKYWMAVQVQISSEASWSGSTLFAKAGYVWVQQDKGYFIMPPTSKKLEGHIASGLFVRPSVCHAFWCIA